MGELADFGRPMDFERRLVPTAALAVSLLLHGALLLAGWFGTRRSGRGCVRDAPILPW